jgi:proline dehydrogenase
MPEPTNNNGGAGDDAAKLAADKAAADAAAAKGSGNGASDGEEMITMKKSDLKKIEEDRDNYRQMGLQKKADEKSLHKEVPPAGDGGAANQLVIDEKKISETATAATTKALREASERTAKRIFLKNNPEYADDAQWNILVSNLTFRGNEVTSDDVLDRMEAALVEHKRSTGKLSEYMQKTAERERQIGRMEGRMDMGRADGGVGDRNQGGGAGVLSPAGERMARMMHVDPEKVRKVDIKRDREISNP